MSVEIERETEARIHKRRKANSQAQRWRIFVIQIALTPSFIVEGGLSRSFKSRILWKTGKIIS